VGRRPLPFLEASECGREKKGGAGVKKSSRSGLLVARSSTSVAGVVKSIFAFAPDGSLVLLHRFEQRDMRAARLFGKGRRARA
jgi:hypothetical protein